jgi:hypothetical protein
VALDRAGVTVYFETSRSLQPARQVNAVVSRANSAAVFAMARIFPNEISIEDARRMVSALSSLKPYSTDNWNTASFDFVTPDITVNIRLPNGVIDSTTRGCLELVITLLPAFHGMVADVMGSKEPSDGSDEHYLSWLDIDGNEVDVCYNCASYNSNWGHAFRFDDAGQWEPLTFAKRDQSGSRRSG